MRVSFYILNFSGLYLFLFWYYIFDCYYYFYSSLNQITWFLLFFSLKCLSSSFLFIISPFCSVWNASFETKRCYESSESKKVSVEQNSKHTMPRKGELNHFNTINAFFPPKIRTSQTFFSVSFWNYHCSLYPDTYVRTTGSSLSCKYVSWFYFDIRLLK